MSASPDILILGGGVIGLTIAYYLAREKARVEVIERGDFGREASWAGAGIIAPGNFRYASTPFDQLRAYSSELFPVLSRELRERTGLDNGYLRCGGLEWVEEEAIIQAWRDEELTFEKLAEKTLLELEPNLAPGLGVAYYLPDMAQVRNPRHIKALLAGCANEGVMLRTGCHAYGFKRAGSRIIAVQTSAGERQAERFVLATGAWTDLLLLQAGCETGIKPVRGQIVLLKSTTPLLRKVLLQGKRYLVPRADSRILVGSTEEDVGFDKHTTVAAIQDLLGWAVSLIPSLGQAQVENCWAGLRPGSPDEMPFLGPVPGMENLFIAAGHFRHGIQLSPGTGWIMKELLLGQRLTISLDAWRLGRPPVPAQYRTVFRS